MVIRWQQYVRSLQGGRQDRSTVNYNAKRSWRVLLREPKVTAFSSDSVNHGTRRNFMVNQALSFSNEMESYVGNLDGYASIVRDIDSISGIPLHDIRNFCFIAHVDHGKSSLASRVLELAGNLGEDGQKLAIEFSKRWKDKEIASSVRDESSELHNSSSDHGGAQGKEQIQLLDTLAVEQERGITVKASAASMLYRHPSAKGPLGTLLLNMVDTPGHADFGFEVTRSLSSVQGAVILFDAAQGVQAQTFSVYEKARRMGVTLLPALTKIDLPTANPIDVALGVSELFNFDPDKVIHTSARSRIGVKNVSWRGMSSKIGACVVSCALFFSLNIFGWLIRFVQFDRFWIWSAKRWHRLFHYRMMMVKLFEQNLSIHGLSHCVESYALSKSCQGVSVKEIEFRLYLTHFSLVLQLETMRETLR